MMNDPNEYYEEYEDDDELYDDEYADAILDACDEGMSSIGRAINTRKAIGLGLLKSLNDLEKDDFQYLLDFANDYCLDIRTVLSFASERLADIYCVGDLYLEPVFSKSPQAKKDYIIKKMLEWEELSNETMDNYKYNEKAILKRVFHMPGKYVSAIIKYAYTKGENGRVPIKTRIIKLLKQIKYQINNHRGISSEELNHFKALFDDCINGKRANNLRWLIANNQLKNVTQCDELEDDGINTLAYFYSIENTELLWRFDCISKILKKEKINLNDREELVNHFYRINSLVVVARNEYYAEQELGE